MSTISQTPKINTVRTLNTRNSILLVIAAIIIAIVVVFASTVASPADKPVDHSALTCCIARASGSRSPSP